MGFVPAVSSAFRQYAKFSGRACRSEFWWFSLFETVLIVVAALADSALNTPVFTVVVLLALLLPSLAVAVRRLHDTGRSGWWYLIPSFRSWAA